VGKVLGYDASGIVEAAGPNALFKTGDEVIYAGAIGRPGSNAQLQLVDSRIVARKPANVAWADAAAIPLVGLTAWEMLEDHFKIVPGADNSDKILIVINAAGGVGTMAVFLASKVSKCFSPTMSRLSSIHFRYSISNASLLPPPVPRQLSGSRSLARQM
jgi:NADPH:quinone reductase